MQSLQWLIQDFPLGAPTPLLWGDADFRQGRFLTEMYAKTEKLGPVGGGRRLDLPLLWSKWIASMTRA